MREGSRYTDVVRSGHTHHILRCYHLEIENCNAPYPFCLASAPISGALFYIREKPFAAKIDKIRPPRSFFGRRQPQAMYKSGATAKICWKTVA